MRPKPRVISPPLGPARVKRDTYTIYPLCTIPLSATRIAMLQTVAKRSTLFAPRAVAAVTQRGLAIDGMKGEFWGGVCTVRAPVL